MEILQLREHLLDPEVEELLERRFLELSKGGELNVGSLSCVSGTRLEAVLS